MTGCSFKTSKGGLPDCEPAVSTADANTERDFLLAEDKGTCYCCYSSAGIMVAKVYNPTPLLHNGQCTSNISLVDVDEVESLTTEAL